MRTESPSTTDRNLKSRYLDHDRQKQQLSHDMGSKKVMLTDLCPQEKIKIGQLIEALEQHKNTNLKLKEQLTMLSTQSSTNIASLQTENQQLREQIEVRKNELNNRQKQCQVLRQEIAQMQEESLEKEITMEELTQQLNEIKDKVSSRKDVGLATGSVDQQNAATQTKERVKKKHKATQVNTANEANDGGWFRPHSKSFEKIMKNRRVSEDAAEESSGQAGLHVKGWQDDSAAEDDRKLQDEEQIFEELAHELLQQKKSCIEKLKKEYRRSRLQSSKRDEPEADFSSAEEGQGELQFDDLELNKVLKSKNFSASKLLESKIGYLDSKAGKTSKWTSSHDKPPRAGVQDRKASPSANESRQSSRNNNINFYESDLLELVDSMNK